MRYSAQTLFYDTRDWHRVADLLKLLLQIMSDHEETVAEAQEREAAARVDARKACTRNVHGQIRLLKNHIAPRHANPQQVYSLNKHNSNTYRLCVLPRAHSNSVKCTEVEAVQVILLFLHSIAIVDNKEA